MFQRKHSREARQKIAAASGARANFDVTRKALAKGWGWNKGIPFSEASRKLMSDAKIKRPVRRICTETGGVKIYSCASAAKKEGFNAAHIGRCCRGERKMHQGYKWEFDN